MRRTTVWVSGLLMLAASGCATPDGGSAEPPDLAVSRQEIAIPKQTVALSTGIQMAYVEMGNPAGEPVIFLHGYTDTARSFHPTASALADLSSDHHIFVLDQRGHGASSMPPAATCASAPETCFEPLDMAEDVVAFMDAKGICKAAIVGHSMGSFVAQELGLSFPDRVDSLVLIGTSWGVTGNVVLQDFILSEPVEGSWKAGFEGQGYTFPDDVYNLSPLDANAGALAWMEVNWVVDPAADPAYLAEILPETAATKMGTWIGVARALLQYDNTERLKGLTVPSLTLWATQDGFFYDTDQAILRASLGVAAATCKSGYHWKQYGKRPLSELGIQIDDLGHNTQWGAPDEVAADVDSFLDKGKPTKDWYYSANGDPQQIVTKKNKAPIFSAKQKKNCH